MLYQPEEESHSFDSLKYKKRPAREGPFLQRFKLVVYGFIGVGIFLLLRQYSIVESSVAQTNPVRHEVRDEASEELAEVIESAKIKRLEAELELLRNERDQLAKPESVSAISSGNWRRHRVYCMVPTIFHPHRYEKIKSVVSTWGKRCDILKFFIDPAPEGETFPEFFELHGTRVEMVQVPLVRKNDEMVKDKKYAKKSCTSHGRPIACRHIWEKVWRSWVYIADNDLDKADYFFKIDDDTFVFVEFLKLFFESHGWEPETPRYFGHVSYLAPKPFVNGAFVGLSRAALRAVAPVYKTMPNEYGPRENFNKHRCVDRDGASQEVTEAICLDSINITATSMVDWHGFPTISVFRISDSLFVRKREGTKSWYWYRKPATHVCCSEMPIAFHWYKHPEDLVRIDSYLYDPDNRFIEDEFYSRKLVDALKEDPKKLTSAVISKVSPIPMYVYHREIEYMFKVRDNLRLLGAVNLVQRTE